MARVRGEKSDLEWLREGLHREMKDRNLELPRRMVDAGFGEGDWEGADPRTLLGALSLLTQYAVGKPVESVSITPEPSAEHGETMKLLRSELRRQLEAITVEATPQDA